MHFKFGWLSFLRFLRLKPCAAQHLTSELLHPFSAQAAFIFTR
ncbi:hypothetical protein [Campylobacter sp.]|nr:hypothetical protein [Campylobacter sp.]